MAYEDIRRRIVDGEIRSGERLVIDRLAKEYGTSIIPVREALARLMASRLLVFEPNYGYRVAPEPGADEIRHGFEARLVLEKGAVELGMPRATREVTDQLRDINERIRKGRYGRTFEGLRQFVEWNQAFHNVLVGLAANPLIDEAYRQLAYHQQTLRYNFGRGIPDLQSIVQEHDRIIHALEDGNRSAAAAELTRHIMGGYERLLGEPAVRSPD